MRQHIPCNTLEHIETRIEIRQNHDLAQADGLQSVNAFDEFIPRADHTRRRQHFRCEELFFLFQYPAVVACMDALMAPLCREALQ